MPEKYCAYYCYDPSLAVAIVFAAIFFLPTALHLIQAIRGRTWYFFVFIVGGCFEVIGFVGRAISVTQKPDYGIGPYIIQDLFLLVAPAIFSASIYMTLHRLMNALDAAKYSPISPQWLTKIFVLGDFLSFMIQGTGGGILTGAYDGTKFPQDVQDAQTAGKFIIIGGLVVQLVSFCTFVVVAAIFHHRIYVLYTTSFLVLIRSIYRVVEYTGGNDGYLSSHEWAFFVFDSVMMFIMMFIYNIWHPSALSTRKGPVAEQKDVQEA